MPRRVHPPSSSSVKRGSRSTRGIYDWNDSPRSFDRASLDASPYRRGSWLTLERNPASSPRRRSDSPSFCSIQAGQGSEPELLIPISVVLPYRGGDQPPKREPQLVLCGDPQQLGPIVTSEAARSGELDVSLLERLFEQPIYSSKSQVFPRPFTNLVKVSEIPLVDAGEGGTKLFSRSRRVAHASSR